MGETVRQAENEQKKEFLRSYQRAKQAVSRLEAEQDELRLSQLYPRAIRYDGVPGGKSERDLSDYMSAYDEAEREIIKAKYEKMKVFQQVRNCIEAMEDETEKDILEMKYLRDWSFERIAVKLGYTYRHTIRLHGEALKHFKMS